MPIVPHQVNISPSGFSLCPRFNSYPDNWGQLSFPESAHDEEVSASSKSVGQECFPLLFNPLHSKETPLHVAKQLQSLLCE